MAQAFCTSCGASIADGSALCTRCGTTVGAVTSMATVSRHTGPATRPISRTASPLATVNRMILFPIVGVVIVVAIVWIVSIAGDLGWSVVPTHTRYGGFSAVTCITASDCWAVGYDGNDSPLVKHWNGHVWSAALSPTPPGYKLTAVTCVSASACWAVGGVTGGNWTSPFPQVYQSSFTLIERWNGAGWNTVPPATGSFKLYGITCVSASDCWAMGDRLGHGWALIENGTGP